MAHPFSSSEIWFDGYGIGAARDVWARFWLGGPGSPAVITPVAELNAGSSELWRRFGATGLYLEPGDKKQILQKIKPFSGDSYRFKIVNSLGWSLGYVTPTKVFGAPPCLTERNFGDLDLRKYRVSGTLEQWQDKVLPLCTGNSRPMFAIICAFVGPLLEILEILGIGSFGFQLFGPSSIGKTIVLIVGGSVWGCRTGPSAHLGFLETWSSTLEGVQRYPLMHNDGFLLLDETRLAGADRELGKLVPTFIMRLAEGVGKNRLVPVSGGSSLPWGDWQLVYLGSSNLSLVEIFTAAGMDFDDAYRVRFPDIPADVGCGYGVFEDIHGFENAAEFAKELHARACTYFGAASEHYLERLAKDRHDRSAWLVSGLKLAMQRYRAMASAGSAVDDRISDNFAVVYAAGILARHYGILPWTREQILWAVQTCQRAHHEFAARSAATFDPIAAVRAYITANLPQFRRVPDPSITGQEFASSPGFVRTNQRGATEYLIPAARFDREFAQLNPQRVLRALAAAGLLICSKTRHVSKAPIRSSATDGREYVYRIRGAILQT
jgi:putative DNA primase/helicase